MPPFRLFPHSIAVRTHSNTAFRPGLPHRLAAGSTFRQNTGMPPAIMYTLWGVSLALLAAVYALLRRVPVLAVEPLPPDAPLVRPHRLEGCDYVVLGMLAVMTALLWLGRQSVIPLPPDNYYHLLVARQVYEHGTIPLWNGWEFAPEGRPHLYPPLYHIVLAVTAWLQGGDFLGAFRTVQVFVLPLTLLSAWHFARRLFDPAMALATVLILGADAYLLIVAYLSTPSVLASALTLLALSFYLSLPGSSGGRLLAAGAAIAAWVLALHAHISVAGFGLAGMVLFSLWSRRLRLRAAIVLAGALLMAAPWLAHMLRHADVFTHPLETGLYGDFEGWRLVAAKITWLQCVNLTLLLVLVRSARVWPLRGPRTKLLIALTAAALPVLWSYGGRFYAQVLPYLAIAAAGLFAPHLRRSTWRRKAAAVCLAFCPMVTVVGTGTVIPPGVFPLPSAWCVPPAVAAGALNPGREVPLFCSATYEEAKAAGAYLDEAAPADAIVTFGWHGYRDLALAVAFFANRPIDIGGWEETAPLESERPPRQPGETRPRCYVFFSGWPGAREPLKAKQFGPLVVAVPGEDGSGAIPDRKEGR